jgi:DNA repair exonuclease SbcCD nuclease subunit
MIIFSDLHLCEDSADTVFNEVLPGIELAALERKDWEIAFLGDFWHIRYRVPVLLQNMVGSVFWRWRKAGLTVRLLPGNHDQVDIDGENALEVFDEYEGVRVYSTPMWDKDGFWIPYRQNPKDIEEALLNSADAKKRAEVSGKLPTIPQVLFLHHGIRGAMMNENRQDTEGLPIGMFKEFQKILCGHYHKRQNVGKNLYYIGSPYQTKVDEANQEKGFAVWKDGKLEYVTRQWGKRYHIVEVANYRSGPVPLPADVDLKRDEVRVTTKLGVNPEAVGRALAEMGVREHVVTPEVAPMENRLQVQPNANLTEFARAYVAEKAKGPEGEADRLWRVFQEITGVAS